MRRWTSDDARKHHKGDEPGREGESFRSQGLKVVNLRKSKFGKTAKMKKGWIKYMLYEIAPSIRERAEDPGGER
jgi:hypothetical protein